MALGMSAPCGHEEPTLESSQNTGFPLRALNTLTGLDVSKEIFLTLEELLSRTEQGKAGLMITDDEGPELEATTAEPCRDHGRN